MKIKTIAICASASHYRQVLEIEFELKKLGYKVLIPSTANIMKKNNDFDVKHYKTWHKNIKDYKRKRELMVAHFKKIDKSDAILVTNFDKNGVPGYIGGNVLMEITVAFQKKIPVFILNPISEKLNIKEEIYGVFPIFLDGDLSKIASKSTR